MFEPLDFRPSNSEGSRGLFGWAQKWESLRVRIGEAETHSGHYTRLIGESSFRDYLDLFEFRFFKAKESCHLGDLIRTDEVRGLRAESFDTGSKLAALHRFRDVQADAACAFLGAKQAEVTNNHFTSHLMLICSLTGCTHARPRFGSRPK